MKTIVVNGTTYAMIADLAIYPFQSTAEVRADGKLEVPVSDTVYYHLIDSALEGENMDDTIQRLVHTAQGRKPH